MTIEQCELLFHYPDGYASIWGFSKAENRRCVFALRTFKPTFCLLLEKITDKVKDVFFPGILIYTEFLRDEDNQKKFYYLSQEEFLEVKTIQNLRPETQKLFVFLWNPSNKKREDITDQDIPKELITRNIIQIAKPKNPNIEWEMLDEQGKPI